MPWRIPGQTSGFKNSGQALEMLEKNQAYHRGQNYYKKNSLQRKGFGAITFVIITKESLYKANSLACFLAKRDPPVAATLVTKKIFWVELFFVIITKIITKNNCSKELFCNNFGHDGIGADIHDPKAQNSMTPGPREVQVQKEPWSDKLWADSSFPNFLKIQSLHWLVQAENDSSTKHSRNCSGKGQKAGCIAHLPSKNITSNFFLCVD